MSIGTVNWFNSSRGFGFNQPDNGGTDVFVHFSAVERACLSNLAEDRKISYDLRNDPTRGKTSAEYLTAV